MPEKICDGETKALLRFLVDDAAELEQIYNEDGHLCEKILKRIETVVKCFGEKSP
jgi:hypothetical protein